MIMPGITATRAGSNRQADKIRAVRDDHLVMP
jgi:hypothetical protein